MLGKLKTLQHLWELENLKQVERFCELGLDTINSKGIYVNSDEFLISIDSFDEADVIIDKFDCESFCRVRKFKLQKIDEENSGKIFSDGSKVLLNCRPDVYQRLYKKYVKN